jgi:antitoxin component YwqK of YwqJK toxin-antitoxin module
MPAGGEKPRGSFAKIRNRPIGTAAAPEGEMRKLILAAALLGLGTAAPCETITLKDGTRMEGEVTGELDGTVLVKTQYGALTVKKTDILSRAQSRPSAPAGILPPAGEVSLSTQTGTRVKFTFKTVKTGTSTAQTFYYEDAVLIATETASAAGALTDLKGALKDGTYTEYYDDGALKTVKNMANGKPDGTFKAFFPNGRLQTEARYTNGVFDGPVTIRGETGLLQFEQSFRNGVPDGWFRQYDSQGYVRSETLYVNGIVSADRSPRDPVLLPEPEAQPGKRPKEPESEELLTAKTQTLARGERFSFSLNNKYVGKVQLDKEFNIVGRDGKLPDGTVKAYSKEGKLEKEFVFEKNEIKTLRVYEPGGVVKAEYGYKEDTAVKK